ncbi:hypothetical protein Zmor_003972 [Zophobas morio]|uniref:Uncharacterized protein n=1 Tax=Zophobas morio TaxID=2755281 RepID=A0AA38M182_9CUCU|nr:hypothetical protein Zmor_003972 [Zophobas morio]
MASETEVRANIENMLYTHGVGIDPQMPATTIPGERDGLSKIQEVIDTCDHVIKAAARAGIEGSEKLTRKANVLSVSDRMAEEIITLRVKVSNREAELKEAMRRTLTPVAGLDDAYSSLRRVLDAAYDQAATGKGAERHANARSFESQPMQSISDLLGDNHGLLFQAVKKIQESTRLPHYRRRERELLGAINYIAGAIIFDVNHSAPEETDAAD